MKFIFLGVFVFFFVITPLYFLNSTVMPELQSLKGIYSNADVTASNIAGTSQQP